MVCAHNVPSENINLHDMFKKFRNYFSLFFWTGLQLSEPYHLQSTPLLH
jgi:hypothetical protein